MATKAINSKQLARRIWIQINKYKNLDDSNKYALYMGKTQFLEIKLKIILNKRFGLDFDKMERYTLGQIKNAFKDNRVSSDFIALLERVVDHRNYMAHEYFVNLEMQKKIGFSGIKIVGDLFRGIYELEQLLMVIDFCGKFNTWSEGSPNTALNSDNIFPVAAPPVSAIPSVRPQQKRRSAWAERRFCWGLVRVFTSCGSGCVAGGGPWGCRAHRGIHGRAAGCRGFRGTCVFRTWHRFRRCP